MPLEDSVKVLSTTALALLLVGCSGGRAKTSDELEAEEKVQVMVAEGQDLDEALWVGVYAAAPDAVRMAIENGAAVDEFAVNGETALFEAAKRSAPAYVEVAEVLLDSGADPNRVQEGTQETPFFKASGNPNPMMLSAMLEHGADLTTTGDQGSYMQQGTALHNAAMTGFHANVALLLEAGIDKDAQDSAGRTALQALEETSEARRAQMKTLLNAAAYAPDGTMDYEETMQLLSR